MRKRLGPSMDCNLFIYRIFKKKFNNPHVHSKSANGCRKY